MMSEIAVKVVRVTGNCNARLEEGHTFLLKGLEIIPQEDAPSCQVAFASIVQNAGRLRLHGARIFVACPDPGTGEGGNVIFQLSMEEDDEAHKY
jgi:uncharacterized repeat protein (TIGR04076 family)